MKRYIFFLILAAMFYSCDNNGNTEELGPQHPLVGEWQLTHYGKIVEGNMEMSSNADICLITFFRNGKGWQYYSIDHQLSFKWSILDDQLTISNWSLETDIDFDIEVYYQRSNDWTILELDTDELIVSYLMSPLLPDLEPYTAVMIYERVK